MFDNIEAVIFDMDGVLIDSEPFWANAENSIFSDLGVKLPSELRLKTRSMTTLEVTKFWFDHSPWEGKTLGQVESEVIENVEDQIKELGSEITGVTELLKILRSEDFKIGLATNAPSRIIPIVLNKLKIENYFDAIASSESEIKGKPSPDVYLSVAHLLKIPPSKCLAIEDSDSGLKAAIAAGMKTIGLRPETNIYSTKKRIEDATIKSLEDFPFKYWTE